MAIKLTARDIKARVNDMARRQMGRPDSSWPYWMKKRLYGMKCREALAYLSDERFIVSNISKHAIQNWAADMRNY